MDKIARVRQEIERRLNILTNVYAQQVERKDEEMMNYYHGKVIALEELRTFLDTLSEEDALPCWKKVHTYTEELREGDMEKMLLDLSIGKGERKTKIALPDRVVDALSEEPDKSLEVDLEKELENWRHEHFCGERDGHYSGEYLERSSQLEIARHFAEWQKSQMLKDAVEADVNTYELTPGGSAYVEFVADMPVARFRSNDKVRIVVLKEEE